MKTIILFSSIVVSASALGDCYTQISHYGSYSSRVFKLESKEFDEYEELNPKIASEIVNTLLERETSCNYQDVEGNIDNITCLRFPKSGISCEVPTSVGYFIVHRNSFGSFDHSVMYTRWD